MTVHETEFSAAVEDYAKAIFALQADLQGPVSTNALAERLGVTAASASGMVKKLGELGLVEHRPYKGVELVRKFGRPHERRHSLQIEINRRLYMNETTLAKLDGFEPLRRNLDRLLAALRGFVLARVR